MELLQLQQTSQSNCGAGTFYFSGAGRTLWFSEYQDPNKWYVKDDFMARNEDRRINYEIQEVENGFIVVAGNRMYDGGNGKRYVFNTIKEVNDFMGKRNQEELT